MNGLGLCMAWEFTTVGETDFYLSDGYKDATHMLIINSNAPSNLPALLGIELSQAEREECRVGFVSSKHILTTPHRLLEEVNPMWPIFKYKTTLICMVNAPPSISNQLNVQRNEWLFNYSPARDIVMCFKHLRRIGTLTTFALNRLFTEQKPMPKECVKVDAEDLGKDEAADTLQSIWSWLPPQIFTLIGGKGSIYIMPSEEATGMLDKTKVKPALFDEVCVLLRKDGYKIPRGAAKRAQDLYMDLSSEALERIKELVGAHQEQINDNTGGMFQ